MKKKTYCYENRTFEVEVYNECCGCLLTIYVNEVIRPNRKFFGRTKQFYTDYVILDSILLLMKLLNQLSQRG